METTLCPYKYIFGEPNKGVHAHRLFDLAIVDILCTIGAAYGISKYFNQDFKEVLLVLFLLGIILHRLFCVRTTIDKLIFS